MVVSVLSGAICLIYEMSTSSGSELFAHFDCLKLHSNPSDPAKQPDIVQLPPVAIEVEIPPADGIDEATRTLLNGGDDGVAHD